MQEVKIKVKIKNRDIMNNYETKFNFKIHKNR